MPILGTVSDMNGKIVQDADLLNGRWLVAEKFAERTGYEVDWVTELCRSNRLPARKRGKKWFVDMIEWERGMTDDRKAG